MGRLSWTLAAALAAAIWGTTYLVATQLLPDDRPLLAAVMRALPVGLFMVMLARRLPTGAWWWRVVVLGALNIGLFFALLFVAAYRLPGGVAATVGATQPLLVSLLAWPLLGERFGRRKGAAGVIGMLGVGLLVLRGNAAFDPIGLAAGAGMAASMATGVVLTKRWGAPVPPLVFTAWQLVSGGLLLVPAALLVEGPPPALSVMNGIGFLYLGVVGTGLAYTMWFAGLKALPASAASFRVLLSPVVAAALGYLILDEALSFAQLVGAMAILAGVLLGQLASDKGVRGDAERRSRGSHQVTGPAGAFSR